MQKHMKITKNQFLSAVKNRLLIVGPMATTKPPKFGPTLYIDGGTKWSEPSSDVQLSLGDGDSYIQDASKKLDLVYSPQKDLSDLCLGLNLIQQSNLKIWLWGFLGGEKAHELANLGAVSAWLDGRVGSAALFDQHLIIVSPGDWQLKLDHGFSVMSLVTNEIKLTGDCTYTLSESTPLAALSSLGLSNEASGVIYFSARRPLLILARDQFQSQVLSDLVFCTAHR